MKKPKYKIDDVILYKNRYQEVDDCVAYYQSKIVESYCLLLRDEDESKAEWFYQTEETLRNTSDSLLEDEILQKF